MAFCVVCEKSTSGSLEFCQVHYNLHKEDILGKRPWVKVLKNEAQRERRRREREFDNTSLDAFLENTSRRNY